MNLLSGLRCLRRMCHFQQARFCSQLPPAVTDKFGGVTLDLGHLAHENLLASSPDAFGSQLKGWLQRWREDKVKAAWLQVPIELSAHIAVAAKHGFSFHHAEGDNSMLCQWLIPDRASALPRFATHQVGCSGCVVREDTGQVLVVRDRYNPFSLWKFPGGLCELGEDLGDAAEREVWEETGIKTEFQGIMMLRQQHTQPGAFGRSDMFFVCQLRPLNFDLNPDPTEVTHCEWIDLDELQASAQKSAITTRAVQMVRRGLVDGFDAVTLNATNCKSVYKGLHFQLHEPRVEGLGEVSYQHSLGEATHNVT